MRQHYAHLFSSYATHPFSRWASIHSMKKQGAASVENQKLPDLFRFAGFQRAEHFKGSGKTRKRPIAGPYKAGSGSPDKFTGPEFQRLPEGYTRPLQRAKKKERKRFFFCGCWMDSRSRPIYSPKKGSKKNPTKAACRFFSLLF